MDCAHDMLEKVFILHTICFSIQHSHGGRVEVVNVHTQQKMLVLIEHTQHNTHTVSIILVRNFFRPFNWKCHFAGIQVDENIVCMRNVATNFPKINHIPIDIHLIVQLHAIDVDSGFQNFFIPTFIPLVCTLFLHFQFNAKLCFPSKFNSLAGLRSSAVYRKLDKNFIEFSSDEN